MKYHSYTARHHRRPILFHALGLALVLAAFCLPAAAQSSTDNPQLVSFNAAGTAAGNEASSAPQASADGRYILFMSAATDLVSTPDNNATTDIFLRDTQTGTTTLVSVNASGTAAGNGASSDASMTPDGRYVLFTSAASDLVSGDTNGKNDIFRRDMQTGTTTLVSVSPSGALGGNGDAQFGHITPDGRYVLFTTAATDFAPTDANGASNDVFLRDLQTGTTALVSVNATGTATGNSLSNGLSVTPDGRYVLFYSYASDLGANDANNTFDLYRRDMQTGTTALASTNSDGTRSGNFGAGYGEMSDDGRFVAFQSSSTDLTPDYNNAAGTSVFFHDFTTNTTVLISLPLSSTFGPSVSPRISHDGRYVIFERVDTDRNPLVSGADLRHDKVLRWDRQRQQIIQFPTVNDHVCQIYNSCKAQVSSLIFSPDGRYVAYKQTETKGPGGSTPPNPPPISTGLVVLDTLGQGLQLLPDFFGNTAQDSSLFTVEPGNLIQGPKLTFSSPNSHASQDTNSFADVYLYAPPSHAGIFSLAPDAQDVSEAAGSATLTVSRSDFFGDSPASIDYATSDGTAQAGSDYVATSGTLAFGPGEATKTFSVPIINDQLYEGKETFNVTLSNPTGGGTLSTSSGGVVTIIDDEPVVQFSSSTFVANEASTVVTIFVTRTGDASVPFSVSYATSDGTASSRSDYITARNRLDFSAGQTVKTFAVLLIDDAFVEPPETINLTLSNPTSPAVLGPQSTAQITIFSSDMEPPTANPIDDARFFVTQHYFDFLNRLPDKSGRDFWTDELNRLLVACDSVPTSDARRRCQLGARAQVSTAFFLSIEFQQTGFYVIRLYEASFGRSPTLSEFIADTQRIANGVVVGAPGWEQQLETNKQQFTDEWVQRPNFRSTYDPVSNTDYVSRLFYYGAGNDRAEPVLLTQLVNGLDHTQTPFETRATALRKVVESYSVTDRQYNPALVLMQYFGYLRRNPDEAPDNNLDGYKFWLNKLNSFSQPGEDMRDPNQALARIRRAQMVEAFIDSAEYRGRFGP